MEKLKEENQDREARESVIQSSLDEIRKELNNPEKEVIVEGLSILLKLINNVIKDPHNEKYRSINKNNKKIQATLLGLNPREDVDDLIEALGYTNNPQDGLYEFTDTSLTVMKRGSYFIEESITRVANQVPLTEADKIRMAKVKEEKMLFMAKKAAEEEHMRRLQEHIKGNREDMKEYHEALNDKRLKQQQKKSDDTGEKKDDTVK